MADGNSLLVIGPSWVGDTVMAQSLFKLLKWLQPNLKIDILSSQMLVPLINRMPEIRKQHISPYKHGELNLLHRYQLARKLRQEQYQQAIVLPNSFKSALIPAMARIPIRTGWRGEMRWGLINDLRYLNKTSYPLMIQRFMALALKKEHQLPKTLNGYYPSLQTNRETAESLLSKLDLTLQKPILALCPGAEYGPAKRWPIEYFAQVAKEKLKTGWNVWLFGGSNDRTLTQAIMEETDQACVDLAGKTTLGDAIDLLALTTAVVSNDSGLMHIANALQLPVIVMYGSTSTEFTPPLNDKVRMLFQDIPCRPCFKRECPLKHFRCMKEILPIHVLIELDELLAT